MVSLIHVSVIAAWAGLSLTIWAIWGDPGNRDQPLALHPATSSRLRRFGPAPRPNDWRSWLAQPWCRAVIGLIAGAVIAALSGWMIALIAVPLLAVALPTLLRGHNSQRDIDRLVAMEEWTRSLSGLLTAGASLEQALIASLRGAPAPIRPQISRLVARLRAHWRSEQAIAALGDELADPTGDIIAATLLLGARQRGFGLAAILSGLAESVSLDVRGRRQVEAEAAKPRATARWVTAITLAMLAALMASGSYFASYRSGIGQIILAGLLCSYLLILAWMRRIAAGPSPTRPLRLEPETHRISQHGSETDLTDSDLGIASPLRSTGAATSGLTARQPAVKPSDRDWAEAAKSRPGQSSPWPVRLNQHSLWIEQS